MIKRLEPATPARSVFLSLALAFAATACHSEAPDRTPTDPPPVTSATAATATAAPAPAASSPQTGPGASCERNEDCAFAPGAECRRGGALGPKKGGLCRLECQGRDDARCAAPNACMSVGPLADGVEHWSCEQTCAADSDCRVSGLKCLRLNAAQPGFCVRMSL